eukprot:2747294-Pleurochrysis_carterae.AAC.3
MFLSRAHTRSRTHARARTHAHARTHRHAHELSRAHAHAEREREHVLRTPCESSRPCELQPIAPRLASAPMRSVQEFLFCVQFR